MAAKKSGPRPLRPPRKPRKPARLRAEAKAQKLHVKSGDLVRVIAGKDAPFKDPASGEIQYKEGRVLRVIKKTSRAVVEGVNMMKKSHKPNAKFQKGGILEVEAPIHVSNLKVIEPA